MLAQSLTDATTTIAPATLPIGHPLHSTVLDSQGAQVLGGTFVQAFSVTTSLRCLDATFPLAETVARPDGTFDLVLPDPPTN